MAKMKLSERIEKLRESLKREQARFETMDSAVFRTYGEVILTVLPSLTPDMSKQQIADLLGRIEIERVAEEESCDYSIEKPDEAETIRRATVTQYKRVYGQIDNLLRDLPRDKSLEG
jgi:predicted aconitase